MKPHKHHAHRRNQSPHSSPRPQTLYSLLGVPPNASEGEILDAYAELTADVGSNAEPLVIYALGGPEEHSRLQQRLKEAVSVLTHRERRRRYDQDLGLRHVERAAAPPPARLSPLLSDVPPLPIDGDYLRCARCARGLSIEQLSQRTRIARHHLENIEEGRYSLLPARVYLRGILHCIASELGLDPESTFTAYIRSCPFSPSTPPAPLDRLRGDGLLEGAG